MSSCFPQIRNTQFFFCLCPVLFVCFDQGTRISLLCAFLTYILFSYSLHTSPHPPSILSFYHFPCPITSSISLHQSSLPFLILVFHPSLCTFFVYVHTRIIFNANFLRDKGALTTTGRRDIISQKQQPGENKWYFTRSHSVKTNHAGYINVILFCNSEYRVEKELVSFISPLQHRPVAYAGTAGSWIRARLELSLTYPMHCRNTLCISGNVILFLYNFMKKRRLVIFLWMCFSRVIESKVVESIASSPSLQ